MAERKHAWTITELVELFYNALLVDARSENYTAREMRQLAEGAAIAATRAPMLRRLREASNG